MDWLPITATEPNKQSGLVVLASNGRYLGQFTSRWIDVFDGETYENWKIDGEFWDGDDSPTHYLLLPEIPEE